VQESSWQTKANGGPAENAETDTVREVLSEANSLKENMKETEVKRLIVKWLRKKYPKKRYEIDKEKPIKELTEKESPKYPQFDFYVKHKSTGKTVLVLECKSANEDLYKALGQCMCYYKYCSQIPFYLVVPRDFVGVVKNYPSGWDLATVKKIMKKNEAKFGLMTIGTDGIPKREWLSRTS
jgi:hypothetical protein